MFVGHTRSGRNKSGFTLVEVIIALMISTIMVVGIISLLSFNFIYQNNQELRANAMDIMARETEKLKRQFTFTLTPYYIVSISDNRTPDNPYDDSACTLTVQLYDRSGSKLTAPPAGKDRIRVVMTTEWRGRGRLAPNIYRERLVSYLIP
jgi:prepilin-type N-terminal cleavage/methylation domain-containing protein